MSNSLGGKADILYGASGLYKTSQVGWTALYVLERYGKRTRLVSADGGGFGPIQSLIDARLIEVWPIRNRLHFIEAVDKACQGWWPVDPQDPCSPIEPPNANPSIREVGLYAFEGLTSFGSGIMGQLKVPGVQLSQDPNYVLRDGETDYAGGSIAAFGFVQDRIYDFVMKSHMIPLVEKVVWTALEGKGEEAGNRLPVFGPDIEGRKATAKAGQWFSNMFHVEAGAHQVGVDEASQSIKLVTHVYLYLKPHADKLAGIVYPAKVRAPFQLADKVPEKVLLTTGLLDSDKRPIPNYNLKMVYEHLDHLKADADKIVVSITAPATQPAAKQPAEEPAAPETATKT